MWGPAYLCSLVLVRERLADLELARDELAELYPLVLCGPIAELLEREISRLTLAEQLLAAASRWYMDTAARRSSRGLTWPAM